MLVVPQPAEVVEAGRLAEAVIAEEVGLEFFGQKLEAVSALLEIPETRPTRESTTGVRNRSQNSVACAMSLVVRSLSWPCVHKLTE